MRSFASYARSSFSASSIVKRLDLVCGGSNLVMVFSDLAPPEIEMQIQKAEEGVTMNALEHAYI